MSIALPKIYPITDTAISGLSHYEQVVQMIDGGATLIQLRDKRAASGSFYKDAAAALQVARAAGVKVIINDRVDIALALKADGVHLGQTDMPVQAARRLLGNDAIIGFSTHNGEQAKTATLLPIDYLAFGPIFPTNTKEKPDRATGLDELRDVKSVVGPLPLVAIGGITQSAISNVLSAGADALAIISALFAGPRSIAENLRNLTHLAEKAGQANSD